MAEPRVVNADVADKVGKDLSRLFTDYKKGRESKEEDWLEDLKQYHAVYSDNIVNDIEQSVGKISKLYPNVTRGKITQVKAKMIFMLNDMSFEVKPTPIPELSNDDMAAIIAASAPIDETGVPTGEPAPKEVVDKAVLEVAKVRSENMKIQIQDQLEEAKYEELRELLIDTKLKIGTSYIKGPLVAESSKKKYNLNPDTGSYSLSSKTIKTPYLESPSTWDCYLDPDSSADSHGDGFFERHRMSKDDVRKLKKKKFFLSEAITQILRDKPKGNAKKEHYEDKLKRSKEEIKNDKSLHKKYDVVEYWGIIDKSKMKGCGCDVDNSIEDYVQANVWFIDDVVIKIIENPVGHWTDIYGIDYFEKDDRSPYGISLARVMRNSAEGICSTVRLLMDNATYSATKMMEVNTQLLDEDEDPRDIRPWRTFLRHGRGNESQIQAIREINFNSATNELLSILKLFNELMEMETGFPDMNEKKPVQNETKVKTSVRTGNINLTTAYAVHSHDQRITKKLIESLYHWNMEFNPDKSIKGDFNVNVAGYRSLVAKEVLGNALTEISKNMSAEDWDYINRSRFLKHLMSVHDTPELMNTDKEIEESRTAREQAIAEEAQKEEAIEQAKIEEIVSKVQKNLAEAALNEEKVTTEQTKQLENISKAESMEEGSQIRKLQTIQKGLSEDRSMQLKERTQASTEINQAIDNERLANKELIEASKATTDNTV